MHGHRGCNLGGGGQLPMGLQGSPVWGQPGPLHPCIFSWPCPDWQSGLPRDLRDWPCQSSQGCILRELFKAVFLGRKEENAN